MNIETGEIKYFTAEELEALMNSPVPVGPFIPIDINDATKKQKKEMRVSLHDTRSVLGKELHSARRKRILRTLRKKGLLK